MSIKDKVYDWKNRLRDRHMLSLVVGLIIVIAVMGMYIYKKQNEYRQASENEYNLAFFELVDYIQNVENYLLKAQVSNSANHSAEVMTHIWREANLAQSYLARLPIESQELSNTAKFLNQVSDYSYSLSRKNINGENLTQEDLKNIKDLHQYSLNLKNTLNQLSADMNEGRIKWGELESKGSKIFAQEVSNISKDSFDNLEENFHEYAGLIYDGAYSEHLVNEAKRGIVGNEISEDEAKRKVEEIFGKENIKEIKSNGKSENANISTYDFNVIRYNDDNIVNIAISTKGGYVVYMNINRDISAKVISQDEANKKGKEFLDKIGYTNMKETYFIETEGIVTINYAFMQNDTIIYSDLIKVKVAQDSGEVLGIEAMGYLNCHITRDLNKIKVTKEEAMKKINNDLEIKSCNLAIIPTEWQTEKLCWEFKGKINENEFLVYINVENGKEEDILVILNTPNGTLTM